jgi:hypothetical protein
MTESTVLQLRITLLDVQPGVWRRIQIAGESTFWDLHVAIQNAMGWTDSHLHQFRVADPASGEMISLGIPDDEFEDGIAPGWEWNVADMLSISQPRALYEYDFGDSWRHDVVLEDVLPTDGRLTYPRCVSGARACPPEDVGGVRGYQEFLQALADPDHPEHDSCRVWIGGVFDAAAFDPKAVQFEDPDERWQEVFEHDPNTPGSLAAMAPPQVEGGFTGVEIQSLLLAPFAADSPLRLDTSPPEAAVESTPLVRDCLRYLRLLDEEAPLKLTQKGNLPRRFLARLIQVDALGEPWWWEYRAPKNESDAARATLLRSLSGQAGLTRKRHGKLDLTRRGRGHAEGTQTPGALYGLLVERYTTKYNWAYPDRLPESRWLQAGFWYTLYLLQQHGNEPRPATFYAERFMLAFPFALDDFPPNPYSTQQESLARAYEWRVLLGFCLEFGFALADVSRDMGISAPALVRAGPLLHQVVQWRRTGQGGSTR